MDSLQVLEYNKKQWEASLAGGKLEGQTPRRIYPPEEDDENESDLSEEFRRKWRSQSL